MRAISFLTLAALTGLSHVSAQITSTLVSTKATSLTPTTPIASASPTPNPNVTVNQPSDVLDVQCASGYSPGFQQSSFQYDIPVAAFINATGSFFHSEWYSGPLNSTNGTDNTPGATRSGNFGGTPFTERLVGYTRSPNRLLIQYVLNSGPVTFPTTPKPVDASSYFEEYTVSSICAGTGTYVTLTASYCTKTLTGSYNLYVTFRREVMATLANTLGAQLFDGSCPVVSAPASTSTTASITTSTTAAATTVATTSASGPTPSPRPTGSQLA